MFFSFPPSHFHIQVIESFVYSGSRDETVRVWNSTGECVSVIKLGSLAFGVMLEGSLLYIRDSAKRVVICEAKVPNKVGHDDDAASK